MAKKEIIQKPSLKPPKTETDLVINPQAADAFAEINQNIEKGIAKELAKPLQLSWLPNQASCTTLFSPVADHELKTRHTRLQFKTLWGKVTVEGPPLNTTDEGILMVLLHMIREKKTPVVRTEYAAICDTLGVTANRQNVKRIREAIRKLTKTAFEFEMKKGDWTVEHMIKQGKGTRDFVVIEVDPWFYAKFLKGEISLIDLDFRQQLRGDVCKALYRFIQVHDGVQQYTTEALAKFLKLPPAQKKSKQRDALKRAFTQLRSKSFLRFKYKNDLFYDIQTI